MENFHTLKEVQSLDLKIRFHLQEISKEEDRIVQLNLKRDQKTKEMQEKEQALAALKAEIRQAEKQLSVIHSNLEKASQRIPKLTSEHEVAATQKELQTFQAEKAQWEEKILASMEKVEHWDQEIKDEKTFLAGSEKSLDIIRKEVEQRTQQEKKEILNYQKRIETLLETCPPLMRTRFLALNEQYRFRNPLAYVIEDTCSGCKMAVNRKDQSNIEKGLTMEYCTSCGRIFVPSSLT